MIQIRLKGCKGILVLNPDIKSGIVIRPSMEKFEWTSPGPYPLGITGDGKAVSR